ncbi:MULTISPECIES: hypothetical protein [Actinotignum]|uniref:DUF389 domain-containing protein n=1 Tax=Actinotignum timonense TaxID=1870995 RepID=A0AAW9HA97_9ACTO|nr:MULTISPECIES: hypothetical protein [Actinotignum]MBS5749613.1 hypothetical protein [Actinotignum schaalii]MDE1536366.1 hypothetical protein [Actinotignum schaalii]MDE1558399.1 hypothetical protein [Actinotignum schaalii]MDE1662961.1 hypothetical protein [Actinotignum schaalii]MDK6372874.1 hypothetical protein [Actinotignum timonense]
MPRHVIRNRRREHFELTPRFCREILRIDRFGDEGILHAAATAPIIASTLIVLTVSTALFAPPVLTAIVIATVIITAPIIAPMVVTSAFVPLKARLVIIVVAAPVAAVVAYLVFFGTTTIFAIRALIETIIARATESLVLASAVIAPLATASSAPVLTVVAAFAAAIPGSARLA